MQRLAILTVFATAAAVWVAIQQRPLVAFQAEAQTQQPVPADDATAVSTEGPGAATEPAPSAGAEPPVAAPAPTPPDPAIVAAAEKLLRDARDRLYAYPAVRANFVERATIGARRFSATGTYLSGKFPALKLEYRVQVGGSEGLLTEVCDGNVLRTSKEIRPVGGTDEPTLTHWTRKDIKQILEASSSEGTPDAAVLQAELSLGGIPTLLTSLERTMLFDSLRNQTWQGRPVSVIEGGWRSDAVQRIVQQMGPQIQQVANFIPDRVRVYFDEQTLFPIRILYRKRVGNGPSAYVPLMSLEFTDVQFPVEADPEEFRYVPPKGVDEVDETPAYIQLIEQIRASEQQAAQAGQPVDATQPGGGEPPSASSPAAGQPAAVPETATPAP